MNAKPDLVTKYSRQAPRYTSYPSALHFKEIEEMDSVISGLVRQNESARSVSLYIHLPFCASLCWYCGCTKVITRRQGDSKVYLERLYAEMQRLSKILNPGSKVIQLHFGGGTPTFLTPGEIRELGQKIRYYFRCDPSMEFAVEIDPRRLTQDHVSALAETGCNRASLGIQDIHNDVQQAINRIQPMSVNKKVTAWLRDAGIQNINIDLIYGLPLQSPGSFESTLNAVKVLDPNRLAIFNYAHIPWMMPSQKLLDRYPMPDAHEKYAMLEMMTDNLTGSGYEYIGMDHFAKVDDELVIAQKNGTLQRNFQGYSTHADTDVYGLGMSSISQVGDACIQSVKDLDGYYSRIDQNNFPYTRYYFLTHDDKIRRHIIMKIMCDLEIDFENISEQWNLDTNSYFSDAHEKLEDLCLDGLISQTAKGYHVTHTGRKFLRNIASAFDVYINTTEKSGKYSKTV